MDKLGHHLTGPAPPIFPTLPLLPAAIESGNSEPNETTAKPNQGTLPLKQKGAL
jgi:hypothetical protein